MTEREALGRVVREAWVRWALTQPSPKPTWLAPYDALDEPDREADRQIGEAVAAYARSAAGARAERAEAVLPGALEGLEHWRASCFREQDRAERAEAELARVTAERDEARRQVGVAQHVARGAVEGSLEHEERADAARAELARLAPLAEAARAYQERVRLGPPHDAQLGVLWREADAVLRAALALAPAKGANIGRG